MRPSDALNAHRTELRQLIIRFGVLHPRVFGSVVAGTDAGDSDLDILVDSGEDICPGRVDLAEEPLHPGQMLLIMTAEVMHKTS